MVWTLVEPGVAIVASSLVTIRPLLRRCRLKGFESSQRSRSKGLWGRYGRSGGKVSEVGGNSNHHHHNNKNLNLKMTTRSGGGMPGMGADEVGLSDLQAGRSRTGRSARSARKSASNGGGGGVWSRETTLTSRTLTHGNRSSKEVHAGRGRGDSVREDKEVGGGDGPHHHYHEEDDGDAITPVSPWPRVGAPADSSSESVFVIEGAPRMMRGHLQGGKPVWRMGGPGVSGPRAGAETPNSPEESEAIQGLRQSDPRSDGKGRLPLS